MGTILNDEKFRDCLHVRTIERYLTDVRQVMYSLLSFRLNVYAYVITREVQRAIIKTFSRRWYLGGIDIPDTVKYSDIIKLFILLKTEEQSYTKSNIVRERTDISDDVKYIKS